MTPLPIPDDPATLEALNDPAWENTWRIHDWRNYIPEEIRAAWPCLAEESRHVAFILATRQANNEDWE